MLLIFFLLLPLVIVPFLIEQDNRWYKRFAYVIAGVQVLVMLFRFAPDEQARTVSFLPHAAEGIGMIIKMVIHIY